MNNTLNLSQRLPWFLVGVIGLGAAAGIVFLMQNQNRQLSQLHRQLAQEQENVQAFQTKMDSLNQKMTTVQTERTGLEKQVTQLQGQLKSATDDLSRAKENLDQAQQRYDLLSVKEHEWEAEMQKVRQERDTALAQAEEARQEQESLQQKLVRLRSRMDILDRDYTELMAKFKTMQSNPRQGLVILADSSAPPAQSPDIIARMQQSPAVSGNSMREALASINTNAGVGAQTMAAPSASTDKSGMDAAKTVDAATPTIELAPIRVTREQDGKALGVSAQIVEVNDPHRFIILNRGSNDGVQTGMVFNVMRDSLSIGQVRAMRVRPGMTACDILTNGQVRVGDLALESGT